LIQQVTIEASFDLLDLHALAPARYPHLLESAAPGPQGRYDILFAFPGDTLELRSLEAFDFLDALDDCWAREAADHAQEPLPFSGGWFLYLGYELAAQIEPQLELPADSSQLPVASATRCPAAVIHDHKTGGRWIVSEQPDYLSAIQQDVRRLAETRDADRCFPSAEAEEDPPRQYLDAVGRILRYIRDGDVFQVNLSRAWHSVWPQGIGSHTLYRRLRQTNPGPYNGLATWGDKAIISSSPERLVEVRGERLQTRPIAGTRPRGQGEAADRAFCNELLAHPKERAENIMLIDLERNDLGRVAVPGSVQVSELMVLESYATVHHIVSNIQAHKRRQVTPGQVIRAVFPGGTITGCPKVRCMEIIAELENTGRGAYTGSMGYLNRDGSMDLNILIRTLVRSGDQLGFRAGAGIVADSVPERELAETRAKAAGMLAALGACGQ
jgi:anthranilate synthase component 1